MPGEHLADGNHTAARRAQNAIFWCHPNHQHHHQIAANKAVKLKNLDSQVSDLG